MASSSTRASVDPNALPYWSVLVHYPRSAQLLDPSGRTVAVNPAWERLWGLSLGDLAGYNVRDDPQLHVSGVAAYLEKAFAGEAVEIPSMTYDPVNVGLSGRTRIVQATASPVFDDEGQLAFVLLVHEDVTSEIAATEQLERARELLEESQRSAHVGSWSWDIASGKLEWTDELFRIYGIEPNENLDFARFRSLVHPDDRAQVDDVVAQSLRSGTPFSFDHRITLPDGETRMLNGRGRVVKGIDGQPLRMVGSAQDITEQVRALEAERAFEGVWEHAPIGIAVYDASADFVCVRHNTRFLDLVGEDTRRIGSVAGVPLHDLFDDDSFARVRAVFVRVRDAGEPYAVDEFPAVLLPDPEPRWYKWSLTPVRQNDQVAWLLLTAVEVTGLVRTRRERQALLDAAVEGIFGMDANARCTFINPAACRLLGYTPEECIGANMHELTHFKRPDGSPYPMDECPIYQAYSRGESAHLIEETLWKKNGEPLRALYSVSSLLDDDGNLTGGVVSIIDIEERIRAEDALRASEARFRTLVDSAMVGVVLGDAEGGLHYVNDAYLRLIKHDRADFDAGRINWAALTPADWLHADAEAIAEARERGVSTPYEKEYLLPDGSRVPVLITLARIETDREEQLIGAVVDLRERKRLERLQRDFLAMVTHDLRTPLTSVRANAQMLLRLQEYKEPMVNAILTSTERMARLINDLADVVRLESDHLELHRSPTNLVALAEEQALVALPPGERQRIRVESPDGQVMGEWDADRLAQVLQNLLGNAVRYAPGSDITVRIEALDEQARLSVNDRGPGIDPKHLSLLFDRFYRAEASGAGGLGLGLYISRMLVEAHGGRIEAASTPGKGSTFTVTLPLHPSTYPGMKDNGLSSQSREPD